MNSFQKAKQWWINLPWYYKVLGLIVLVFAAALSILQPSKRDLVSMIDEHYAHEVDNALELLEEEAAKADAEIKEKKKAIATSLNQAGDIDATTVKNRKRIDDAKTMEELDALQKELDL